VIVLSYNPLYRTYTGNNGIMYFPMQATTLVMEGYARYKRGHAPGEVPLSK